MNKDVVAAYIDQQTQRMADETVKPLMTAIEGELRVQATDNKSLSDLTAQVAKNKAESDKRITAYQESLAKAKAAVADFSAKLAASTEEAVN